MIEIKFLTLQGKPKHIHGYSNESHVQRFPSVPVLWNRAHPPWVQSPNSLRNDAVAALHPPCSNMGTMSKNMGEKSTPRFN